MKQQSILGFAIPKEKIYLPFFPDSNDEEKIYISSLFSNNFLKENVFKENEKELSSDKIIIEQKLEKLKSILKIPLENVKHKKYNEESNKIKMIKNIFLDILDYKEENFSYEVILDSEERVDFTINEIEIEKTKKITPYEKGFMTTVVECKAPHIKLNKNMDILENEKIISYLHNPKWKFKFGIWTNAIQWVLFIKDKTLDESYIEFDLGKIIQSKKKLEYFFLFLIIFRKRNIIEKNQNNIVHLQELCNHQMIAYNDLKFEFIYGNTSFEKRKNNMTTHLKELYQLFSRFDNSECNVQIIFASMKKLYVYILFIFMLEHKRIVKIQNINNRDDDDNNTINNNNNKNKEKYIMDEMKKKIDPFQLWKDLYEKILKVDDVINLFNENNFIFFKLVNKSINSVTGKLSLSSILKSIFKFDAEDPIDFSGLDSEVLAKIYESSVAITLLNKDISSSDSETSNSSSSSNDNEDFTIEWDENILKEGGLFYTPIVLVDDMIRKTLKPVLINLFNNNNSNSNNDNQNNLDLNTLRIIDPSMGCGSFLIGCVRYFKKFLKKKLNNFYRNYDDFQHCVHEFIKTSLYGVELRSYATGIARASLILELGNLYDEDLFQSLKSHLVCGDSITGSIFSENFDQEAYDDAYNDLLQSIDDFNDRVDDCNIDINNYNKSVKNTFTKQKKKKEKIDINLLFEDQYNIRIPFIYDKAFPDVFQNGGFNVVIGNPPWKSLRLFTPRFGIDDDDQKEIANMMYTFIKKRFSVNYNIKFATSNLWILFCIVGYTILKSQFYMTFIIPQSILSGEHASETRSKLFGNGQLDKLYILNETNTENLFPSITQATCIFALRKNVQTNISIIYNGTVHTSSEKIQDKGKTKNKFVTNLHWTEIDSFTSKTVNVGKSISLFPSFTVFWNDPIFVRFEDFYASIHLQFNAYVSNGSHSCGETDLKDKKLLCKWVFENDLKKQEQQKKKTKIEINKKESIQKNKKEKSEIERIVYEKIPKSILQNNNSRYFPAIKGANINLMRKIICEENYYNIMNNDKERYFIKYNNEDVFKLHAETNWTIIIMQVRNNCMPKKVCHTLIPPKIACLSSCEVIRLPKYESDPDLMKNMLFLIAGFLTSDFIDFYFRIHITNNHISIQSIKEFPFINNNIISNINFKNNNAVSIFDKLFNIVYTEVNHLKSTPIFTIMNELGKKVNDDEKNLPQILNLLNLNLNRISLLSIENILFFISISSHRLFESNCEIDRFTFIILINQFINHIFKMSESHLRNMYRNVKQITERSVFLVNLLNELKENTITDNNNDDDDNNNNPPKKQKLN